MVRAFPWIILSTFALACGDDGDAIPPTPPLSATGGGGAGGAQGTGGASTVGTGGAGAGAGGSVGSDGCGTDPGEATEEWLAKTAQVGGMSRDYFVRLPPGYDPDRAYPVVYQFHGCSNQPAKENNHPPLEGEVAGDAILVRGRAVANCWELAADGPDVAFFDAMLAETEATYCADPARRFATGYSSGAFMSHRLSCERGDQLRGVATIAGGLGGNGCEGQVAALLIHDTDDGTVPISQSESARDRYLADNGCGDTTTPVADHPPCVRYEGCDAEYPVVWCQTSGNDHSRQDGLAAPAFWEFLAEL